MHAFFDAVALAPIGLIGMRRICRLKYLISRLLSQVAVDSELKDSQLRT
jgi:hypothetical protein